MNQLQKTHSMLLATVVALGLTSTASADRPLPYNPNYDQIVRHATDLEYVASNLKDCFRDQFRGSRLYGKLISKANRLRNRARSLQRHGASRGNCNWGHEIRQLDDLVCGLRAGLDEAVQRSRTGYDRPICRSAIRTASNLLNKAEWHVNALQRSLVRVQRPSNFGPHWNAPIVPRPAPQFGPAPGLGYGNGFRTNDFHRNQVLANRSRTLGHSTRGFSRIEPYGNGLAVNIGGFRFHVNN